MAGVAGVAVAGIVAAVAAAVAGVVVAAVAADDVVAAAAGGGGGDDAAAVLRLGRLALRAPPETAVAARDHDPSPRSRRPGQARRRPALLPGEEPGHTQGCSWDVSGDLIIVDSDGGMGATNKKKY